jgi:uncharacterized YigZ family protein
MAESFQTVYQGGTGEIIEKKSRFIATAKPVQTEAEAIEFIEQIKKKYWDASHNCSAYVIGEKDEIMRCSDDGEPSKTAGKPMLDVLIGEGLHNVAVVVTRYFGGTLLGTGGLVRAYQGATKEALNNSIIIHKIYGNKIKITTDYNGIGKLQYIAAQMDIITMNTEYTDIVVIIYLITSEKKKGFIDKVIDATNGTAGIEELEAVYYAKIDDQVLIF